MESFNRYGAAPPPKIPVYYIKVTSAKSTPPGMYVYPSVIKGDKDQAMGIAIKRFYYLKDKSDLSYHMSDDGKGEIAELSKDNSLILTLDETVNVVNGLLMQLERNGYTKEQVLAAPLP